MCALRPCFPWKWGWKGCGPPGALGLEATVETRTEDMEELAFVSQGRKPSALGSSFRGCRFISTLAESFAGAGSLSSTAQDSDSDSDQVCPSAASGPGFA